MVESGGAGGVSRGSRGGGVFEPPARLIQALLAARRPFLCTHIYPDGDALGSTVALARILRARGSAPSVLLTHPAPEKLSSADPDGIAAVLDGEPSAAERALVAAADAVVVLDTSDPDRLGRLEQPVFASAAPKLLIDHHICPDPGIFDVAWSVPESPSTGNLVLRIHEAIGGDLDRGTADALFVAIATDTGWFQFSNATPEAFRAAAVLRDAGVDPEALHREIHERSTPERTRALGEVLAGLRTELGGRVAYGVFTAADRARHGIPLEELDGFIDALKQVRGAEIVFLVVELSPGRFKVSLRSKGAVDVHPVASRFGGGGHAKAAGCRLEGTLIEVADRLVDACRDVFDQDRESH